MTRADKRERPPSFAIGLDGTVYVDMRGLDDVDSLEDAVKAIEDGERCFVGVAINGRDLARLRRRLTDAGSEAAGFVLGARRWRRR